MSGLKTYMLQHEFDCPYVIYTGHPRNPNKICKKRFLKGQLVKGELKHANNQPAFVLSEGRYVFPLNILKEVVTRDVVQSNADGGSENKPAVIAPAKTAKVLYIDGFVIGAVVGFGVVYGLQKMGKLEADPTNKTRMYGAGIGAALGIYAAYRYAQNKKASNVKKD